MATAIVFSGTNLLAATLVERLLTSGCEVFIVSQDLQNWKERLGNLTKNHNLKLFADNRYLPRECNYVFSVNGFGYASGKEYLEEEAHTSMRWASDYSSKTTAKFINILSYLVNNDLQKNAFTAYQKVKTTLPKNTTTLFVAEVYGKNMHLLDGGLATKMIKDAVFTSVVTLPHNNQNIYYSFVDDCVSEIIRLTFSFGTHDQEIVITESDSAYNFFKVVQSIKPTIMLVQENLPADKTVPLTNLNAPYEKSHTALTETIAWLSQYTINIPQITPIKKVEQLDQKQVVTKSVSKPVSKHERKLTFPHKFLMASLLVFVLLLSSPFIALLLSLGGIKYAYGQFKEGNIEAVERVLVVSTACANFSNNGLQTLTNLPIVGGFFDFSQDIAYATQLSGEVALDGLALSKDANKLANSFFGVEDVDLVQLSSAIYVKSQTMYTKFNFLNAEVAKFPNEIKKTVPIDDLEGYTNYLYALTKLAPQLPTILGASGPKTYLILFQNNMELRPTGGFIGSFALVTLDKGRLADIDVHDVYAADGQLKGHVEPPAPIKNYLGEANWFLRDSNWDPDFMESAKRAEWFLAKEIDRDVDGVIGVDMEVAKSLLTFTGPVTLADFNQTLDEKNVYERIQYEVESDFFPGSQRKDSILTSLVRAILAQMTHLKREDAVVLAKIISQDLKSKHIQIYLHNQSAQEGVEAANWDGRLKRKACTGFNCQAITVGLSEANVGVNKANYFVKRKIDLHTKVIGNNFDHTLTLRLQNTATPSLGLTGKYKPYVRALLEGNSQNIQIDIVESTGRKFVTPEISRNGEFVEAGTILEIQPGQTKEVVVKWTTPMVVDASRPGSLVVHLLKQAGTGNDEATASLTVGREVKYNTMLDEDKAFLVNW